MRVRARLIALACTRPPETAAGLGGGSAETCYESVRVLQGAQTLTMEYGAQPRLHQHWSPPRASTRGSPPFEEAAIELRKLLTRAVAEKGRTGEIDEIAREFQALVASEADVLNVELTTAFTLSDDDARDILGQIEQASGRTVEATRKVDPDLIGGIVLQAGSMRLDASVRGRLERLRHELVTRS